ncbi:MAG TPA: hypothetical protein VJ547_07740 [Candidatus Thermoplasmatota archaeon]|nr:hypothetical protein [Candidatus Thermoplasmatota archaeon]
MKGKGAKAPSRPVLQVVAIGAVDPGVLSGVGSRLEDHGFAARTVEGGKAVRALVGPGMTRLQALNAIPALRREGGDFVLGLTDLEVTDGVKPWVYGMGELNGRCAVFSTRPFRQGGLSSEAFLDQLSAAVVHELAHNVGIVHCRKRDCLMHATHEPAAMRQLERKFCESCERQWLRRIRASGKAPRSGPPN